MRCYFMKDGHITAVRILNRDSDKGLLEQAKIAFYGEGGRATADGFEIWDGPRFVFRFPTDLNTPQVQHSKISASSEGCDEPSRPRKGPSK